MFITKTEHSIWDFLALLRQIPVSVYIRPIITTFVVYALLGTGLWLGVTPLWKEAAGEWEVIGKYIAGIAWFVGFPIAFNLILSLVIGVAFDPVASRVDRLLHSDDHIAMRTAQVWTDSILRAGVVLLLHGIALLCGLIAPIAGLILSGVASIINALLVITTPATFHCGLTFKQQVQLLVSNFGLSEVCLGVVASLLLGNPLVQVIALVPLIVLGQLFIRGCTKR